MPPYRFWDYWLKIVTGTNIWPPNTIVYAMDIVTVNKPLQSRFSFFFCFISRKIVAIMVSALNYSVINWYNSEIISIYMRSSYGTKEKE